MYEEMDLLTAEGIDWHKMSLNLSHLLFDLMDIQEVRDAVKQTYVDKMRGKKDTLLLMIEAKANKIESPRI